ncbi:hypothetical protein Tco_0247767 [Tanacetum coccineum]
MERNIMKSIKEGTISDGQRSHVLLLGGTEGAIQQGLYHRHLLHSSITILTQRHLGICEDDSGRRTKLKRHYNPGQAKPISATTGEQVTNVDDNVDDSPENDLALNVDHVFEAEFMEDNEDHVVQALYLLYEMRHCVNS